MVTSTCRRCATSRAFCALLGAPELADDPRYADLASRVAHRAELDAEIGRLLRARPTAEWVEVLADAVPCGPVLAVDEVFADPQVEHLHLTRRVEHPTAARSTCCGPR